MLIRKNVVMPVAEWKARVVYHLPIRFAIWVRM